MPNDGPTGSPRDASPGAKDAAGGKDAGAKDAASAPADETPVVAAPVSSAHPDGGAGASPTSHDRAPHVPRWIVLALCGLSMLILWPYWIWLVLAVWVGQLGRRMVRPLTHLTGRRQRAAAILTAALVAIILVPVGLVVWTLVIDAIDLAKRLLDSPEANSFFEQLVTPATQSQDESAKKEPLQLVAQHGGRAWPILRMIFTVAAEIVLGLFIFISGTFIVLAEGPAAYRWLEQNLPLDPMVTRRFAAAFTETGHGLFVGVGGSGLCQAIVATAAYFFLDVPEPFVLGLLTLLASILPSVGTALVWVPVTIGLGITGRTEAAIVMGVVGVAVIGSIDNIVRPILARRARLELPSYLIMVSMFGGIAVAGASGVVLGPLVLRLAKEALLMAREERVAEPPPPA